MVRKFRHHEKKLLKKVDFLQYRQERNIREVEILRKYHVQRREDYTHYNKVCGMVKKIAHKVAALDQRDEAFCDGRAVLRVLQGEGAQRACCKVASRIRRAAHKQTYERLDAASIRDRVARRGDV